MKLRLTAALSLTLLASASWANPPEPPAELAGIPVSLLVDMGSPQELYARQPDQRFLPASMTKVMTAYVAFELMMQGKLKPDQLYTVSPQTAEAWSGHGTSMYLKSGEEVSADSLLHGIATASANDASVVLAEGFAGSLPVWTAMMNASARRLGMADSHFKTANGWPDNGQTYVTAHDLVKLSRALIARYPVFYRRYFGHKRFEWKGRTLVSHDPTVGIVPGADGIKTGHTNEAGYNFLGSAQRNGRRLVMVIGGARTEAQRAAASRALIEWGFTEWKSRPLFAKGARVGFARVQDGTANRVALMTPRPIAFARYADDDPIYLRLSYRGPLKAPVAKGVEVASLIISTRDGVHAEVPLVAATAVDKAGPLDRLVNGLKNLFL